MATVMPGKVCLGLLAGALVAAGSAWAGEPPVTDVSPIRAASRLSFSCAARALPTQREVGEALGQYNFGQVYASRARLMSEVGRACQRPDVQRVDVVLQPAAMPRRDTRYVAARAMPAR